MSIFKRITNYTKTRRGGATCFSAAVIGTGLLLCTSRAAWVVTPAVTPLPLNGTSVSDDGVGVTASLSQTKLVAGYGGEVYLKFGVSVPKIDESSAPAASDVVVVLDRSGSMSAAQKMPYAKAAIYRLISELGPQDKFALVSFDSYARVDFALAPMTDVNRRQVQRIVSSIRPGSSTNMSGGMEQAQSILRRYSTNNRRRVILLSDGEANAGKTSPQALSQIARDISGAGGVVSAIGMGLSFNEIVLSGIADNGMGHYSFLEDVRGLQDILAKDLMDSRSQFAKSSMFEITLPEGVTLMDAAGFPVHLKGGRRFAIETGQLIGGVERFITLSLNVPTRHEGEFNIGPVHFVYSRDGEQITLPVGESFALAVVSPEQRGEAIASIDNELFKNTWAQNNLGRMRKDFNSYVREGKKEEAQKAIASYGQALRQAEEVSGVALMDTEISAELDQMKADLDDAFVGSPTAQQSKQSRLGKLMHLKSLSEQRLSTSK